MTIKTLLRQLLVTILAFSWFVSIAASDNQGNRTFNAGLKIISFDYTYDKKKEIITVAIWYPTFEKPARFFYHKGNIYERYESKLAVDASIVKDHGPFPLILFSHGAYGDGFSSSFLTEYLARHGYIVVAPDFKDTRGPEYTEQIAFSRIKGGNTASPVHVLRIAKQFVIDMEANRNLLFWYMAKYRLKPSSFVIDRMLELNRDKNSFFYQCIDEKQIGMCGHSLGGLTTMGKIGAHPEPEFKDTRIKAGLMLSAPAYPFENTINNIDLPIMVMRGDNDPANLGGELGLDRKLVYEKANPPKYYIVLKNATHFCFTNRVCGGLPLYQATEINIQAKAICEYSLAFFERYLCGSVSAENDLKKVSPAIVYYESEDRPGGIFQQGKEPLVTRGISDAIREEMRKELKEKIEEKKGRDK